MARHPQSERFHQVLKEIGDLHDKKQADYGRGDDPFANVRGSQEWGVAPWVGAMVRATDKLKRLQKYAQDGELANEGARDSFLDGAVYHLIALVLWEEEEAKADEWATREAAEDKAEWEQKYGSWTQTVAPDWAPSVDTGWVELSAEQEASMFDKVEADIRAHCTVDARDNINGLTPLGVADGWKLEPNPFDCVGCDVDQKDHNIGCPQRSTDGLAGAPKYYDYTTQDYYVPAG